MTLPESGFGIWTQYIEFKWNSTRITYAGLLRETTNRIAGSITTSNRKDADAFSGESHPKNPHHSSAAVGQLRCHFWPNPSHWLESDEKRFGKNVITLKHTYLLVAEATNGRMKARPNIVPVNAAATDISAVFQTVSGCSIDWGIKRE